MARVKAFVVAGIQMWFWSQDHDPPHFHAKRRGQWQTKVYILSNRQEMIELIGGGRISASDRDDIVAGVEKHRVALLKEWHDIHSD